MRTEPTTKYGVMQIINPTVTDIAILTTLRFFVSVTFRGVVIASRELGGTE